VVENGDSQILHITKDDSCQGPGASSPSLLAAAYNLRAALLLSKHTANRHIHSTVAIGKMGSSKSAFHTGVCVFGFVSVLYVTAPATKMRWAPETTLR